MDNLTPQEKNVLKEIQKANFCQTSVDCVRTHQTCPFGCCTFVHRSKADYINDLIESVPQRCYYMCAECQNALCQNGKCQAVIRYPENNFFYQINEYSHWIWIFISLLSIFLIFAIIF